MLNTLKTDRLACIRQLQGGWPGSCGLADAGEESSTMGVGALGWGFGVGSGWGVGLMPARTAAAVLDATRPRGLAGNLGTDRAGELVGKGPSEGDPTWGHTSHLHSAVVRQEQLMHQGLEAKAGSVSQHLHMGGPLYCLE
jgi:hypothetical protein